MGYECVMCMETLESGAPPQISNNEDGTSRTKAKKRGRTEDLSEICATPCGHMFHKACLIRWFEETEKKACPSCRKPVVLSKLVRMYPPRAIDNSVDAEEPPPRPSSNEPNLNERGLPPLVCKNRGCTDLHVIHKTLVNDFNSMSGKYGDKVDEVNFLAATNASLEDEIARLREIGASLGIGVLKPNPKRAGRPILTAKPVGSKRMRKTKDLNIQ